MKMGSVEWQRLDAGAGQSVEHPGALGALLVQAGSMSAQDVETVLNVQRNNNLRFGEVALMLSLVEKDELDRALNRQFAFSHLHDDNGAVRISADVVVASAPASHEADQVRAIRSHLMLRWLDKTRGQNVLCLVGAERGEGRSYLAANLAAAFAQAGERTLLIDGNLRNPVQHDLFGATRGVGLSSVLAGHHTGEAVAPINGLQGLFLLAAGAVPPNPLELLTRPTLTELLRRASSNFDMVIIDTPSLCAGADAEFLASRARSSLVVARTGLTRVKALSATVREFQRPGMRVAGIVWNDIAASSAP
jgi:protein-tyrosine kinase